MVILGHTNMPCLLPDNLQVISKPKIVKYPNKVTYIELFHFHSNCSIISVFADDELSTLNLTYSYHILNCVIQCFCNNNEQIES